MQAPQQLRKIRTQERQDLYLLPTFCKNGMLYFSQKFLKKWYLRKIQYFLVPYKSIPFLVSLIKIIF